MITSTTPRCGSVIGPAGGPWSPNPPVPSSMFACLLLLREHSEFSELRYADVDAALDGRCVLFAGVKFLGERAVLADEERVLLEFHRVALVVEFQGVFDV